MASVDVLRFGDWKGLSDLLNPRDFWIARTREAVGRMTCRRRAQGRRARLRLEANFKGD